MIAWQNELDGYRVETLTTTGAVLALAESDATGPVQWFSRWIAEGGHSDSAVLAIDGHTVSVVQGENAGQGVLVVWAIENGIVSNELVLMLLGEGYGNASAGSAGSAKTNTAPIKNALRFPIDYKQPPETIDGSTPFWINDTAGPTGGPCFQAGEITHDGISQARFIAPSAGVFTVGYRVSSENSYDFLTAKTQFSAGDLFRVSGVMDWETTTVHVVAGEALDITFTKDGSLSGGLDTGWITVAFEADACTLQGPVTLCLTAKATLKALKTLKAGAALRLIARNGSATAPTLRLQLLNDQLLAMVTASPSVVRLAWAWNNDPLAAVVGELLNPDQGMPLILKIPGFIPPNDPVTNIITVQAWQEADGRTSAHTTATIEIKPTTSGFLKPPQRATAIQLRNWTTNARDLTRVEWDWGDDEPGMVEVCAYVRPVTVTNPRQIKTIHLGVMDSTSRFCMAESIGIKILKVTKNAEPVYFGIARYLNGQSGPELFTPPISINCGIEEAPAPLYSTPQMAIEASINNATGISPSTIHAVLQTALTRIKWVIARGGLVDLDQFGQFKAVWNAPITRIDPITGKVTLTPSQRTARFTFKPDFIPTPSR